MLFRTRDLLVRQRTQMINALRGHLAEFGVVAAQGPAHVDRLASALEDPGSGLSDALTKRSVEALQPAERSWIAWDDRLTGLDVRIHTADTADTEGYAADWTVSQLREPAQRIADRIEALLEKVAPNPTAAQAESAPTSPLA